jgi:hypothetical protein
MLNVIASKHESLIIQSRLNIDKCYLIWIFKNNYEKPWFFRDLVFDKIYMAVFKFLIDMLYCI